MSKLIFSACSHWRVIGVPFGSQLVSVTRPEYAVFGKLTADGLRADRETVGRKSTRYTERRYAAEVERFRENIVDYKAMPFVSIDLERVRGFFACRV